jgi:hypothetical protein
MKCKFIFVIPLMLLCCLFLSGKAFAAPISDIEISVTSPIDSLQNESGMVAVEQFPAEIPIRLKPVILRIFNWNTTVKAKK